MKIKAINITEFGGLKNFSLELSDSLNIIIGDNESGKSTVLLFIAYMLYGIAKKGTNAAIDKARSISWESSRAEGQMDVLHDGKEYRITRALKGKTSVSTFKVFDLESGEQVDCDSPADLFLGGVSRETFESCCLCGQLRAGSINGTQVSETLSNLSLGADESVNADAVIETVRKARKEYKHERGRGGLIDEVTDEIDEVCHKKLLAEAAINAQISNKASLEEKKLQHSEIEKRLDTLKKIKEKQTLLSEIGKFDEYESTKKSLSDSEDSLSRLSLSFGFTEKEPNAIELGELRHLGREYQKRKENLSHIENTAGQKRSKIDIKAKETAEKLILMGGKEAALKKAAEDKKKVGALKAIGVLSAIFAVISFALCAITLAFIISGGVFGIASAVCFALAAKTCKAFALRNGMSAEEHIEYCFAQLDIYNSEQEHEKKARDALNLAKEELSRTEELILGKLCEYSRATDGAPLEALYMLVSDVNRYIEEKSKAEQRIALYNSLLSHKKQELEGKNEKELREKLEKIDLPKDLEVPKDLDREILVCRELEKKLSGDMTDLRIKIESSADNERSLAILEEKHRELEAKRLEYTDRYEIFGLALDSLEAARDNLQRAFAPEVRKKAGDMLRRISNNKHSSVFLTNKLEATLLGAGSPRSAELLSGGTSDALYIALRLALLDSIFGTNAPLILDETLSQVDDKRAAEVLELINEFTANGGQCLFFSCHKREAALCTEHGITHNSINI